MEKIQSQDPGSETNMPDLIYENLTSVICSVGDPDPYVFGPPRSGSVSHRYSESFFHQVKIGRKTLSKNSKKRKKYFKQK
jgi:hypothetical protein